MTTKTDIKQIKTDIKSIVHTHTRALSSINHWSIVKQYINWLWFDIPLPKCDSSVKMVKFTTHKEQRNQHVFVRVPFLPWILWTFHPKFCPLKVWRWFYPKMEKKQKIERTLYSIGHNCPTCSICTKRRRRKYTHAYINASK